MTEVFVKKVRDRVISVNTKGHAGFAKRGKDIVCSAVSVLLINTVNSIKCFTEDEIEVESDQQKGEISILLPTEYSEKTDVLLKALLLGLSGIEEEYPKNFRLYTEEVLK